MRKFGNRAKMAFLDTETTGLDVTTDRVLQVAVTTSLHGPAENKLWYINELDAEIHEVCSFTQEDLASGEHPEDFYRFFYSYLLKHDVIIAYNASFDLSILAANISRTTGIPLKRIVRKLSRKTIIDPFLLYPFLEKKDRPSSQFKTALKLGFEADESRLHDAGYDVELLKWIYFSIESRLFSYTPRQLRKIQVEFAEDKVVKAFKNDTNISFPFRKNLIALAQGAPHDAN